jgi:integrase
VSRINQTNQLNSLIAAIRTLTDALNNSPAPSAVSPPAPSFTFFSWLDEWLDVYKAPAVKPGTLCALAAAVRVHIKPNIPDKPLETVTGADAQRALNAIRASRTRKSAYYALNGAFKKAVRLGLIAANPMNALEPVRHAAKQGKALTREQQTAFLAAIKGNRFKALYEFYLLTGCRRAEALAVTWGDVDRERGRIRIQGTKTANAARYVPLFPAIAELLGNLPQAGGRVFKTTVNAVRLNFRRLKIKHGFNFRLHDLRHTFATRCLECGISVNALRLWLGHSRVSTTANIYQHVQTDFERQEAAKFSPVL